MIGFALLAEDASRAERRLAGLTGVPKMSRGLEESSMEPFAKSPSLRAGAGAEGEIVAFEMGNGAFRPVLVILKREGSVEVGAPGLSLLPLASGSIFCSPSFLPVLSVLPAEPFAAC